MKKCILFFMTFCATAVFAQYRPHGKPAPKNDDSDKEKPVNYSDIMDDPSKPDKLMMSLNLLGFDIGPAAAMGWGIHARYNLSEKLTFDFDIFAPYAKKATDGKYGDLYNQSEAKIA